MPRLGLTQRVEVIEDYGERRDCLDQAWATLLEGWGFQPVPLPNRVSDVRSYAEGLDLDGVVLTSGNDLAHLEDASVPAPERDSFESKLLEWAIDETVPVLGVCRGLELLNHYFGGSLSQIDGHVAIDHEVRFTTEETETFELPDRITTNSFHDYGIKRAEVADELDVLAVAPDESVECVRHREHPLWGIMWHPERETDSTQLDRQLFESVFRDTNQ